MAEYNKASMKHVLALGKLQHCSSPHYLTTRHGAGQHAIVMLAHPMKKLEPCHSRLPPNLRCMPSFSAA